jgi:hypothetical protein
MPPKRRSLDNARILAEDRQIEVVAPASCCAMSNDEVLDWRPP